jgi:hypothetical protein
MSSLVKFRFKLVTFSGLRDNGARGPTPETTTPKDFNMATPFQVVHPQLTTKAAKVAGAIPQVALWSENVTNAPKVGFDTTYAVWSPMPKDKNIKAPKVNPSPHEAPQTTTTYPIWYDSKHDSPSQSLNDEWGMEDDTVGVERVGEIRR